MAQQQVAARTEGDVFQGMFFWLQAAMLLRPSSRVRRVALEYDQAAGVDDVAVFYTAPGVNAGKHTCTADFFQVKYHVDRRDEYSAANLCDPRFIGATRSLLQRFHDADGRLRGEVGWYRLSLVSNWTWSAADPLAPLLRESESGALPERFFHEGPRSALGKIREKWREHLGLTEEDFEDFARRLQFGVDFLGRRGVREWLSDRLRSVGLREIPADRAQNTYDSLSQQFVMSGTTEFDHSSFRAMCKREGLLDPTGAAAPPVLGIRSFLRFAERIEDECERFVCVARHFDGRHARDPASWQNAIRTEAQAFLTDPALRGQEHHLLLECHSSLAFLAGYEIDRKSGAEVFPVQKGVRKALWKPSATILSAAKGEWQITTVNIEAAGPDVAMAVSVTRDVLDDVNAFVRAAPIPSRVVDARPASGVGARAVTDADHAVALADGLAEVIRIHRPSDGGTTHLFVSAPNALMFFLGQHRGALGRVQLYEFDFEGERGGSYSPSMRLPA